jgi:DNA-binding beta-propeller fold protein YncE
MRLPLVLLTGFGMAFLASPARTAIAPEPAAWHARVEAVGGEGRWDLLAADGGRVYLSRSDHMDVVDGATGKSLGHLAGTDGIHGVALAPARGRGWTSNGKANSLTEFDLHTLQRVRDLPLSGQSPDAITYDAASGHLFAFNARSNNASVIDPATGRELAVIAFEGNPELPADDGKGRLFVNIEDKAQIAVLDTRAMKVTATWALAGCEGPTGLALDVAHQRLFSACDNGVMVVTDASSGRQVARVAIGEGPDGAAFDPQAQEAFSPNGRSGTLSVVHEDDPEHYRVVQTLDTARSARTIALDASTHRLYLPSASFGPKPADPKARAPMLPGSFALVVVTQ